MNLQRTKAMLRTVEARAVRRVSAAYWDGYSEGHADAGALLDAADRVLETHTAVGDRNSPANVAVQRLAIESGKLRRQGPA